MVFFSTSLTMYLHNRRLPLLGEFPVRNIAQECDNIIGKRIDKSMKYLLIIADGLI